MTMIINDATYEQLLASSQIPVLIDFFASWCGPCQAMAPVIDELATAYADKVRIVKCNVEESPMLSAKYGIRSIPSLFFFRDGEVVDRHVGALSRAELKAKLDDLLQRQ